MSYFHFFSYSQQTTDAFPPQNAIRVTFKSRRRRIPKRGRPDFEKGEPNHMITHVDGPRTCRCRSRCGAPHPTCPWRCGRKVESILSNAGKRRGSKAKDEIFCPACRLATLRLFGDDISESHPLPRQPFGRPTKFNGTPPDWVVDINGEEGAAPRFRPGDTSAVSPVQPRLFQPQIVWMGSVCECRAACGAKHLIDRRRCGRKPQVTSHDLPTDRSPKSRNSKLRGG